MAQDNLTIEELLEIAEGKGPSHVQEKRTDVNKYIKHFNIKAGETLVPAFVIYYHYRKWRKQHYMAKNHFFKHFNQIYEVCKTVADRSYYLDPEPFDMTLEGRVKARVFSRKDRDAKRKKKKTSKS
jgi:hypothetical protein